MPEDRTALEHLLDGRDALLLEVERLNTAIEELDAVIRHLGGGERRPDSSTGAGATSRGWGQSSDRTTGLATSRVGVTEPIIARREAESDRGSGNSGADRNRRGSVRSTPATNAEVDPPRSIRVHVLEMLAAENREFGLAELIDGVHEAGIQAHDDAVRSITIKLMKDGKVERVGRGQYRLAREGSSADTSTADDATLDYTAAEEATLDDTASDNISADDATLDTISADDATPDEATASTSEAPAQTEPAQPEQTPTVADEPDVSQTDTAAADQLVDDNPADDHAADYTAVDEHPAEHPYEAPRGGYTPPLNLGQPWNR